MLDNGAIQDASTKLCISPYRGTAYPPNNSPLVVYKTCTKKTRYFTFTPSEYHFSFVKEHCKKNPENPVIIYDGAFYKNS